MTTDHDLAMMRRAIHAAATSRCTVSPRPWVGAVLEPDGSTGATEGRSGPHAEVVALRRAGETARGATMWVTLEPCSHHGRTPPCADAVIEAGVARVVVGIEDPDPNVAGQGITRLREAGVEVEVGVAAAEVEDQLAPYLTQRRTGRPLVVLKLAATLDGRTAAPDGTSQWITGPEARADAHRLRAESDAVLVGAGTVRADDPSLTVRLADVEALPAFRQPLRVVLGQAPEGAKVHPCLELDGDLGAVLDDLGARGVLQVLVEGGAQVAADLHRAGLVDRYVVYLAPALFGGDDARGLFAGPGAPTIDELWRGRIAATRAVGDDLRVDIVPGSGRSA
jgi:diaminohydroxyphosphoribosylaminopyrimidine deaminase/5-amino-6-(5-phosphoribosylamino)uracil reductase